MVDTLKRHWLLVASLAIQVAVGLYAWPRVPDRLPVHWGFSGEPDRFSGRLEALGLMPLILLAVYLLLTVVPRFDRNGDGNLAVLQTVRTFTLVGLTALYVGIVSSYLGWEVSIVRLAGLVVGVILLATGNVLPKAKPSAFVGVRLPWTLTSKKSWYGSQRAGGWLLALTGAAMVVASFLFDSPWTLVVVVLVMLVGLIGVGFYSYVLWRGDEDRERAL